ncbi:alpha/beta hydrolase [Roseibium sediminis]|uniref:alpha/beta hydrolase n=1 Tax=Roseibium sediminis TaxID=1775174 RepID=UPI001AD91EA6|nr:alpha/beta hydrolase [Roseibium sediminis]
MSRKSLRPISISCLVMAFCVFLAACGSRPVTGALEVNSDPAAGTKTHDILIATTRERDETPGTLFNGERRGNGADYAEATISVPPTHKPGMIEWPKKAPGNPATDFVARKAGYIDGDEAFKARLNARLAAMPKGKRKVFLFIHGYNTLFAEGLYRFTQFVHDAEFDGVPVLFTWASRGQLSDYVYDLNSASVARDSLERTVRMLNESKAEDIVILAHSMGNWLMMETAARIPERERQQLDGKVSQVILAAPDIDIDVFKSQLRRIGKPQKPYLIVLSKDDRALRVSRAIAGGKERVGAFSDDKELAELGAIVVDLTDVESQDGANHSKFAQLAAYSPELRSILQQRSLTQHNNAGALAQTGSDLGSFIGGTVQTAVTLPIRIVTAPLVAIAGQ